MEFEGLQEEIVGKSDSGWCFQEESTEKINQLVEFGETKNITDSCPK
jgi:hypothetical protein